MLQKGDTLKGRYVVLEKVGSGGHGTVFRARDKAKNRLVAIKVLRPDLADDPDYIRRFRREASIAALLDSRHVVRVLETDHARLRKEEVHFQVMEFVDGPTLQQFMRRRGRLSTAEALNIAIQMARALEEAQDKGVLHHDIKPKNVFMAADETVRVGDFGIACATDFPSLRPDDPILGTPAYMSPERCRGDKEQVDFRSDIYSLGVVLYEMLAGRPPFEGDSPSTICYRQVHDTPAPLTEFVLLPEGVQDVVQRCLQKDPRDRFQSPRELRRALEELIAAQRLAEAPEEMQPLPTAGKRSRERGEAGVSPGGAGRWPGRLAGLPPKIPARVLGVLGGWWGGRGYLLRSAALAGGAFILVGAVAGIAWAWMAADGDGRATATPTRASTSVPSVAATAAVSPTPSTTSTLTPTPAATPTVPPAVEAPCEQWWQVIGTGVGLNVHESPGIDAPVTGDPLPDGFVGCVEEGPVEAGGHEWLKIRDRGWAAKTWLTPVAGPPSPTPAQE